MSYHGDFALESTFDIKFTTVSTTGAPTTLAGTPVVSAYPGNSTTELTAGITLTVDFDARTGMHNVRVVATAANGYATATNYALVITTGTVGGTSVVGYVVGSFSVEARSALRPTTTGRTLDVSTGGEAGVDWANVGSPTTTVGLSGTTISTSQAIASVSGAVGSVTGAVGSVTGAVGSVTGNVGGNVTGSVGSVATGGIVAGSFAAGAIDATAFAQGAADKAWSTAARTLTAATNITSTGGTTVPQTGDSFARLGAPAGLSVSADVAAVKSDTGAIKAKTDSLTFTVAGQVDANTKSVNSVTVTGAGTAGDPWGP